MRKKSLTNQKQAYLFLLPWFLGMLVFFVVPVVSSLYLSFTNYAFTGTPKWTGLQNYQNILQFDSLFKKTLEVTIVYVFVSVPVIMVIALAVAMLLNQKIRGLGMFRAVYYLPSLIGGSVAVSMLWRHIFGAEGIINRILAQLGILMPSWVGSPQYALAAIVFLKIWQFGAPMVIFLAGLKNIPAELYEASEIDGASKTRQFLAITLPTLSPIIFFNLVQQIIQSFQAFTPSYIISNGTGGPVNSLLFYTLYIYQTAFRNYQIGYASALGWILLVLIALFTAICFKTSKYWVFYND